MAVKELAGDDTGAWTAWDRFVAGCPDATFFHRAGWKRVIENSFRHRTYFLYDERGGVIEGVLPLVHVKSAWFGNSLTSSSFCVYGGPAAASHEARESLVDAACRLADRLQVDHLEFRAPVPSGRPGWVAKPDLYVTFRKPIDPDAEKNMLAIPRKQRAMVRKAIKLGLTSAIDADTGRMHRLYAESVRNLGTPVFAPSYFANLKAEFGDDCDVLTVLHDGRPVSAVLNFYFRDQVLPYYGGGGAMARNVAANDFMYWEVMRRAAERGYRVFDFGRSKRGTGAYDFKRNWGFEPQALSYEYRLAPGRALPDRNPLSPKYRLFVKLWRHLPLALANLLGPPIVRNLG
jgi:FemAB-related protein (PEP-CTERM system-associated)